MTCVCPHCQHVGENFLAVGTGDSLVYFCPKCHRMCLPKDTEVRVAGTGGDVVDQLKTMFGMK